MSLPLLNNLIIFIFPLFKVEPLESRILASGVKIELNISRTTVKHY